jgi:hypothetical protein
MGLGDAPADLRAGPHRAARPSATIKLDNNILERFPVGYRHLAYLQVKGGFDVKTDRPGTDGPAVDALYAKVRTG